MILIRIAIFEKILKTNLEIWNENYCTIRKNETE